METVPSLKHPNKRKSGARWGTPVMALDFDPSSSMANHRSYERTAISEKRMAKSEERRAIRSQLHPKVFASNYNDLGGEASRFARSFETTFRSLASRPTGGKISMAHEVPALPYDYSALARISHQQ